MSQEVNQTNSLGIMNDLGDLIYKFSEVAMTVRMLNTRKDPEYQALFNISHLHSLISDLHNLENSLISGYND